MDLMIHQIFFVLMTDLPGIADPKAEMTALSEHHSSSTSLARYHSEVSVHVRLSIVVHKTPNIAM
jgi:hypothetical protein